MKDTITIKEKAPDRLAVLERIEEYEKKALFDYDVENDPPWEPVNPADLDYLKERFFNRLKARFATFIAKRYFNSIIRKKKVIYKGVNGLENLKKIEGGAIITCNHCHMFDNYAVYLSLKKHYTKRNFFLYKVVREGNYSFPGMVGFFMRNCHTLPVNERGNNNFKLTIETSKAIKSLLERKEKILIYAEQGMWWNYRKPRPLKKGAFLFAAKFYAPVVPCFLTMKDSDIIGDDGFPVQEFTLNILPAIYPDKNLSVDENCEMMKKKNFALWKKTYEDTYGIPLTYTTDEIALSRLDD